METDLQTKTFTLPERAFQWRDSTGRFHDLNKMKTSHLFNVIQMIWNHKMPEDAKTHNYRRYSFGPHYTDAYMRDTIKHGLPELVNRPNLTPSQKARIDFMCDYVIKHPKELDSVKGLLT